MTNSTQSLIILWLLFPPRGGKEEFVKRFLQAVARSTALQVSALLEQHAPEQVLNEMKLGKMAPDDVVFPIVSGEFDRVLTGGYSSLVLDVFPRTRGSQVNHYIAMHQKKPDIPKRLICIDNRTSAEVLKTRIRQSRASGDDSPDRFTERLQLFDAERDDMVDCMKEAGVLHPSDHFIHTVDDPSISRVDNFKAMLGLTGLFRDVDFSSLSEEAFSK